MTTIYRQILTFNKNTPESWDIGKLHGAVMAGYRHVLDGGHDNARQRLNSLFLAQRDLVTELDRWGKDAVYPPPAARTNAVLVQASEPGDWSGADPRLKILASEPFRVDLDVEAGCEVEVRSLINPMKSTPPGAPDEKGERARGKKVPITRQQDVAEWFTERMSRNGLEIPPHAVTVGAVERLHGTRRGAALKIDVRTISAHGTVTDPEAFRQVLINGIGRGRAYGAGLLRHRRVE